MILDEMEKERYSVHLYKKSKRKKLPKAPQMVKTTLTLDVLDVLLTCPCSCRLELAYFAGKIFKNRLVCKNVVALAYYGSCRLLAMGSYRTTDK